VIKLEFYILDKKTGKIHIIFFKTKMQAEGFIQNENRYFLKEYELINN
jgi:hypothetical protein